MITVPEGWSLRAVGPETLVLVPTARPDAAIATYHEHLAPLASVAELIAAAPRPPDFVVGDVVGPDELVTYEGEHACVVRMRGHRGEAPLELAIGLVLLDHVYARVVACARDPREAPHIVETVRAMVRGDVHFLGRHRRRRYRHAAPAGWRARSTAFETTYRRADAPALVVMPALPIGPAPDLAQLAGLASATAAGAWIGALAARGGLHGRLWRATDGDCHVAVIVDDAFAYLVRLDGAATAADLDALIATASSIEPVPRASRRPEAPIPRAVLASSALQHFAD